MTAPEAFTGLVGILIGVGILCLVVAWMIFPFIVLSKANELLKSTRLELEEARKTNQALSEIAKALQWMVNEKAGTHPQPPEAPPVQLFKRG